MDNLEKLGIEIIGGIGVLIAGWLGFKKANNLATSTGAETGVIEILQNELTRLAGQVTQLSTDYASLNKILIDERTDCNERITALSNQINELKQIIQTDKKERENEAKARQSGILKTRKTDKKRAI